MASKTILVADDNTAVVKMLKTFLEQEGFKVITAYDGQDALDKGYKEKPDLILLDIGMPRINGYLVCKKLKGDIKTKDIPIFILAVKGNESDKAWGLGMGADEYLDKSIDPVELVKILKEKLQVE